MQEITVFRPNDHTHKAFGDALRKAKRSGVKILAFDCVITEQSININKEIPIDLNLYE